MSAKVDLTGRIFGRLKVEAEGEPKVFTSGDRRRTFVCICECGNRVTVQANNLTSGNSNSCGCLKHEITTVRSLRHGCARATGPTRTYGIWAKMKARCIDPSTTGYENYGARGIRVCDRWMDFVNFLSDMGECPVGLSIDRIDVNGNYEPSNCRWATIDEQANNKRTTVWLEVDGQRKTAAQWNAFMGFKRATVHNRLSLGWSPEKAVTTPVRPSGKSPH